MYRRWTWAMANIGKGAKTGSPKPLQERIQWTVKHVG